jgi:phytoene desaturase
MDKNVLIVGTGLGGLATALRLVKRGYKVQMVEQLSQAGGRLNEIAADGFRFDIGPTFFSMSYEFDELMNDCNLKLPFALKQLEPLYAVNFSGSEKTYHIYKNPDKLSEQFSNIEPQFREKLDRFLASAGKFYEITNPLIINSNFNSTAEFLLKLTKVPLKYAPKLYYNMWQEVCKYFSSYEVRTIMSLVAFFLGSTPFDTMAVYNVLNYTELIHDGYHYVEGGMYRIVRSLVKILESQGVEIDYNKRIVDYRTKNGRLTQLVDLTGSAHEADIFVINADAALFRNKIFRRKKYSERRLARMKWSMAPFTIYLGIKAKINNLYHHNYFLGTNLKDYSERIFKNGAGLDRPYYYVNLASHTNREAAPEGCESLFILCPVPNLMFRQQWDDREQVADNIITDLSRRINFNLKAATVARKIMTPVNWQQMFDLYKGSGLGLAHNFWQIGGFRPGNYDEVFDNTFYVGSSTVPGTGLPMAIISSKLVLERIIKKYGPLS